MRSKKLKLLFCAAHFFSFITRQNYPAVLEEIISELGIEKSLASVAVMGGFISYGAFQIISGFFGDRFKPQKLIFIGLSGSALINLLICFYPNIYFMNVLWCINGIFQSLVWPPLIRLIVDNLENEYSKTVVRASQSSYLASILIYVFVPIIISFFHWRFVFAFSGCVTLLFSIYWLIKTKNVKSSVGLGKKERESFEISKKEIEICGTSENEKEVYKTSENEKEVTKTSKKEGIILWISVGFVPIIISTFIAGFLRDGITVWMPSYVSDVYKVESVTSILSGAIIPLCCALFLGVFEKVGEKIGNELKSAAVFFGIALLSCAVLFCVFSIYPILDIILMAIITVCIHGVNLMLVGKVPKRFAKYGKSSTASGVINSAVYAGSAVSAFGVAFLESSVGWRNVCGVWGMVMIIAITFLCVGTKKTKGM